MTPRTIKRFSCHDLKLEPFSIGIELKLAIILAELFIDEQRTTNKITSSHKSKKTNNNNNYKSKQR